VSVETLSIISFISICFTLTLMVSRPDRLTNANKTQAKSQQNASKIFIFLAVGKIFFCMFDKLRNCYTYK